MPRRKRIVEEVPVIEGPEFECQLVELNEFQAVRMNSEENGDETRFARYHGSNFWSIKGFGVNRWVIGGYIAIDWKQLMQEGHSVEDIYRGCVKFLNKPPVRRKFQKRITKPLFGILQPEPVKLTPRERDGQLVLEVLMITNKRRSRFVWGEGQSVPVKMKRRALL